MRSICQGSKPGAGGMDVKQTLGGRHGCEDMPCAAFIIPIQPYPANGVLSKPRRARCNLYDRSRRLESSSDDTKRCSIHFSEGVLKVAQITVATNAAPPVLESQARSPPGTCLLGCC